MPATRKLALGLALALAGQISCAANPRQDAAPLGSHPSLDEGAAAAAAEPSPVEALAPAPETDDLEASLAAYEQQLAHNETRLRAMGVRIAALGEAEAQKDDRFAPPPPTRPSDARTRDEGRAKAKKTEQAAGAAAADPGAAPRPQPTTKPSSARPTTPRQPARAAGDDRKLDAEAKNAGEGDRCGELCELADATCDLEAKICDLAARHAGEPRYADVCRRASDDCRLASDACNLCSP